MTAGTIDESNGVVNLAYKRHPSDSEDDFHPDKDQNEARTSIPVPTLDKVQPCQPKATPPLDLKKAKQGDGKDEVPDGGWGWVVAMGAALIMIMINILGPCFSIIFSGFLLDMNTSSTTVGWIFNMFQFFYNFSGPLVGPLLAEFSWRSVAFCSSIVAGSSLIVSALANSAEYLLVSYSVFGGLSCGFLNNLCYMIVPNYFDKRRGMANAILAAGVACGPIVGPLLVSYLLENFGFKGATLITGAIVLNACIGASVFRDPKKDSNKDVVLDGSEDTNKDICSLLLRVLKNTIANTSVLKSPRAVIITFSGALTLNSWLNFITLMPFAVQDLGYSNQDAALCVTTSAASSLVSTLGISVLSDYSFFSMRLSCMVSTATIGAATIVFSQLNDITWLIVTMGVWGSGVGAYMATYNLAIVRYMGMEKLMPTFGVMLMLVGLGFITIGPSIGLIRDLSNSYAVSMYVLSGMAFTCSILWALMPAAVRYDQRKQENNAA